MKDSMSQIALIAIGFALRNRINEAGKLGISSLILQAMLPSSVLISLSGCRFDKTMLALPVLGALFLLFQIVSGKLIAAFLFGESKELRIPRRTTELMLSTYAPGLSASSFISEFINSEVAAKATCVDLANKMYLLVIFPLYIRIGVVDSRIINERDFLSSIFQKKIMDPLFLSVVCGMVASMFKTPISNAGAIGQMFHKLAAAQSTCLFVLLGLKISVKGNNPLICAVALSLRLGCGLLFVSAASHILQFKRESILAGVFMSQSAVSVVGLGHIEKFAADSGSDIEKNCLSLSFDLVSYSFPASVVLNSLACLFPQYYISNIELLAAFFFTIGFVIGTVKRNTIRDPSQWNHSYSSSDLHRKKS